MKILFVIENFPLLHEGRFRITGGVEAAAVAMAEWLGARHDVRVVTNRRDASTIVRQGRLEVVQCGRGGAYRQGGGLRQRASFQREAVAHGAGFAPDVAVGWNFVSYPPALRIARLCGVPAVAVYHDVWVGRWVSLFGAAGLIGEVLERRVLRGRWSRFIAVSTHTRDLLRKRGIAGERIAVVPPSLGSGLSPGRLRAPESDASLTRVVVVTRLVKYKRVDVALHAFARVAHHAPALRLTVIGTGPEEPKLKRLAESLGISRQVEWRGWMPEREDVLDSVATALVYLSASEVEGFGLAAIEAAALGTPFVAADIPAVRFATRDGQGGELVPPGDIPAFAQALEGFLLDPDRRRKKAAETYTLASHYTIDRVGPEFEDVLLNAVDRDFHRHCHVE